MNSYNFNLSISKTQYDAYKYKIKDTVSYSKRKLYRYIVDDVIYNLRTESTYKFLYNIECKDSEWKKFKESEWIRYLTSFNLVDTIKSHLQSILTTNELGGCDLPDIIDDLELNITSDSDKRLKVDWFRDKTYRPSNKEVYLVIFERCKDE